ncbi:MAG: NAD(P)/FAD-dependent oxidoreductase [Gemmatimonadetes bacterium]|nr:NAD(P)/FAD-dependent oxidoreductase [Gemmatimonadota bacterium]
MIVGGGPAGLAAAFWLARYRRHTCVCDAGAARNEPAWAVHGYPGLPDLPPHELRRRLRAQATGAGAQVVEDAVTAIEGAKDAFRVATEGGSGVHARRILLAFGRRDLLPSIPGLAEAYGISAFHCPDCDGPSMEGARIGVIGWNRRAAALALFLLTWADTVVLLGHGRRPRLPDETRATLARSCIEIRTAGIQALVVREGRIQSARLEDGGTVPLDGVFVHLGSVPASQLARRLGCRISRSGAVRVNASQETTVPGVYAAGDLTGHPHLAIVAAAEGVRTALAIHRSLLPAQYPV